MMCFASFLCTGTTFPAPIPLCYGMAASGLISSALSPASALPLCSKAVLGSAALGLVCDFGPSAVRDVSRSRAASRTAVDGVLEASPPMVLVDNFVNLLEEPDEAVRQEATDRLTAANYWALLVRCRVLGDAAGALLMLRGHACFGAALMLSAHAAFWAAGAASARVDQLGSPAPLAAPVGWIVGCASAALAVAAGSAALAPSLLARRVCATAFATSMVFIQAARVAADRMRARTHVGL